MGRPSVAVYPDPDLACRAVALEVAALLRSRAACGRPAVLGLPTGESPRGLYRELVRMRREDGLPFRHVVVFALDELWPLPSGSPRTYGSILRAELLDHLDLDPRNVHALDSAVAPHEAAAHCAAYEDRIRAAGGVDLQILGIGRSGHIGLNEPGSARDSRTRLVRLAEESRAALAAAFGAPDAVPAAGLTLGVGTILEARRITLLAFGPAKREAVRRALAGPADPSLPASFLCEHGDACFVLDQAAAGTPR